jgi:hypothetical protein
LRFDEAQRHWAIAQRSDRDGAVEAGAVADMTTPAEADDLNPEPNRVLVVTNAEFDELLGEAARGPFAPQLLPAAAP